MIDHRKVHPATILAILAVLILYGCNVFGQSAVTNTENDADRNLRGSSRINPSTLAMEFTLPFGTYLGRGGNKVPIIFNYSSKVWHRKSLTPVRVDNATGSGIPTNIVTTAYNSLAIYSKRSISGWTSSLQVPAIIKDQELFNQEGSYYPNYEPPNLGGGSGLIGDCNEPSSWHCNYVIGYSHQCGGLADLQYCSCTDQHGLFEDYSLISCYGGSGFPTPTPEPTTIPTPVPVYPTPTPQYLHIVPRLRVAMPDGSNVEFRKEDRAINCELNPTACTDYQDGDYLSVNGSGMTLRIGDTSVNPSAPSERHAVLYMPGGSKYVFPDLQATQAFYLKSSYVTDINGNTTTFSSADKSWTDTLGRTFRDPLKDPLTLEHPQVGENEFTVPGISRPYKIIWKKLKVDGDPDNSALEDERTELAYLGSDTCESIVDNHPLSPALFGLPADTVIGAGDPNFPEYRFEDKERICGAMPDSSGNSPTPVRPDPFNPVVMAGVQLPNGKSYEFKYNEYAEITRIKHPDGAIEKFKYETVIKIGSYNDPTNRGVTERWVTANGVTQHWTYSTVWSNTENAVEVTIHEPDGSSTTNLLNDTTSNSNFGFDNPLTGFSRETRSFGTDGRWVARTLSKYVTEGPRGQNGNSLAQRDPRQSASVSIQFEKQTDGTYKALATLTESAFDTNSDPRFFAHLNGKESINYNFLSILQNDAITQNVDWFINKFHTEGSIAAASATTFLYDEIYRTRGITSRPFETRVLNPGNLNGTPLAKTQIVYDEPSYLDNLYTTTNWTDPASDFRGNATTTKTWVQESDTWLDTHKTFDTFGNLRKAWGVNEGLGSTNFVETQYDPIYKYAYPTSVTAPAPDPNNATGTNQTSTVTTSYDRDTGLPVSVTDEFGQTTMTEYDNMLRPVRTFADNFVAPESRTIYNDENLTVTARKQIDAANWDEATTYLDSLGRTIKTVAKDSQGDVIVETHYDQFGRVDRVTNPYRASEVSSTNPILWSKTRYDELGRAVETYAPTTEAAINSNDLVSLGVTSFGISDFNEYVGTVVTTTDASGRKGRSITNALGQLIRVDEPTATGGTAEADLGALANPIQPTSYKYDVFGKMVQVTQGAQNRYFKYDALGRLLRVNQPEQEINSNLDMADAFNAGGHWTAGFAYDILGNVVRATDANGVNIINEHDRAGRVTKRCYTAPNIATSATTCSAISPVLSSNTQTVTFFYDGKGLDNPQSPNYAKGKLTKVENGISQTRNLTFDNAGRLTQTEQRTPIGTEPIATATPMVSKYTYNLSGALVEEEYPSGRKVRNEFESDGDLLRIYGKADANATEHTYANGFTYTPDGKIEKLRLGSGIWESAKFNSRLQVTELALGHSVGDGDMWKLGYEYGELNTDGSVNAAKNTGNIAKQTVSFTGLAQPFVQTYKYDSLYRLTEAKETKNRSQTWIQQFGYDRYGNRTGLSQTVAGQSLAINELTMPVVDPSTNRFAADQGYGYDKNGNLIQDSTSEGLRSFVFNADNKQILVKDGENHPIGTYFYDGEGKRVKKVTDQETTIFVYSSGKLVAEYSTAAPLPHPTINYTATDQLGSPRVITDAFGEIVSRRDFMPFGEELYADGQNRTTGSDYSLAGEDSVRKRFTGYEKDMETSLDFAEARYYNNQHARFTAVDPLLASGKSSNPQSFNRYVYVLNNPLIFADPRGLQAATPSGRWYKPIIPDGASTYRYDSSQPRGYEPVTQTNKAGDLIGSYHLTQYDEFNRPDFVIKFNPMGPREPLPTVNVNSGQKGFEDLSHFERSGWDYAMGDGFQYLHPSTGAVEDVSMEAALTVAGACGIARAGFGALRSAAVDGAVAADGMAGLSNAQIIQKAADIAERRIGGTGAVSGTLKHTYAEKLINRYQSIFGTRGLETESSWLNGRPALFRGQSGSVRFDVLDTTSDMAYDFKFTIHRPALTPARCARLQFHGPNTLRGVLEVNPSQ